MKAADPLPRLPYVLLILMSIVSFGGPFVMFLALRGGEVKGWPPDRTWEWAVVAVVMVLFVSLFGACVSIRLWFHPVSPAGSWRSRGSSKSLTNAAESAEVDATVARDSTARETRR